MKRPEHASSTRRAGADPTAGEGGLQQELGKRHPFELAEEEAYLNIARTASVLGAEFHRLFRQYGLSEAGYNVLRILRGAAGARGRDTATGPRSGAGSTPNSPPNSPPNSNGDLSGGLRGGVSCGRVAAQLVAAVPDVTRLIDRLVREGLVSRERRDDDRRAVHLSITPAGLDRLAALDEPVRELHQRQLGHLSRDQLNTLNGLLVLARRGPDRSDARQSAASPPSARRKKGKTP